MIGLDRPLKPVWIYETLKMLKIGAKPSIYNEPFEDIAQELVGKEGKRKVRTVIFRTYIYSFQEKRTKVEDNMFLQWAESRSLGYLRPLFLWKILMDYEIARFITQKISISVDHSGHISTQLLSKKLVQEYGDRDVVKRSLRSFMATLVHFGALHQEDKNNYTLLSLGNVSSEQVKDFVRLYAVSFLKSQIVELQNIPSEFFFFFKPADLVSVAHEYNGDDWEYVREVERNLLIMKGIDSNAYRDKR